MCEKFEDRALRCDELAKLKIQHVDDLRNKHLVSINDTKNDVPRQFMIGELFCAKAKIYEIAHAAGAQINPQPSPSLSTNDCSPESITTRIDNQSTYVGINFKNFFNQFEINDKDLVKIDELDQPDIPDRSEIPSFTTTNNEKILATHNRQSTKHTHFKKKPPVRIFSKKLEYEPPGIQSEIIKTAIHHDGSKRTKSFPTNLSMDKNSSNVYANCIFHGNIMKNFHCSCDQKK
ncbi:hypothetical protein PV328_001056 [Microctonus aethiopoides]|uniref:Uncharacterized protein n=1 Tax=Microctonus aethiopoides TaxID=144406 RepID=A0AA39FWE1_9HYME|nr:hypothetical protein PV328_001056 [Microctonus aethiopoides]